MPRDLKILVKRLYDAPASSDGTRVLVDRLWSRGLQKQSARLDEWLTVALKLYVERRAKRRGRHCASKRR